MADTDYAPPAGSPGAAAMDRIANAGITDGDPTEPAGGAPPSSPPAGTPAPPAAGSDDGVLLDKNGQPYRDAEALKAELKADRERWRPWETAVSKFPEDQRQGILDALSGLGADAPLVTQVLGRVHPDDARAVAAAIQTASQDPAAGADAFAAIADALRGNAPAGAPAADPNLPADQQPLTRAEMESYLAEREQAATAAAEEQRVFQGILAEAKELGYDAESQDPVAVARAETMLAIAARTDGDPHTKLIAADAAMKAYEQSVIDGFVDSKKADALRPGLGRSGVADSGARELHTMKDARAAAEERMAAAFGPERPRI